MSRAFERAHGEPAHRVKVPPFLLFDKPGGGRDVRFRGLLAPGAERLSGEEDLVAVWRTTRGERFQNYRADFTVLNVPVVSRAWIGQFLDGEPLGSASPQAWRAWVKSRTYSPLVAPDPVTVEFALEAKCYAPGHGVGVRETSRLISRLRHRQFCVLVTTSHVDAQAYSEIRDDGHPVGILAGRDVVELLKRSGLDTVSALRKHLRESTPQREIRSRQ